jgi:hypothetical protein
MTYASGKHRGCFGGILTVHPFDKFSHQDREIFGTGGPERDKAGHSVPDDHLPVPINTAVMRIFKNAFCE